MIYNSHFEKIYFVLEILTKKLFLLVILQISISKTNE